jgi:hypothetical protein
MKGLTATKKHHDENSGLPYIAFKIKEGSKPPDDSRTVRVLALRDFDENRPDIPVIESIFMHQKYKTLNPTRCPSDLATGDPANCPLCRVKATRSLRTFIPVKVYNQDPAQEVQVIEYGRNNIQEILALLDELETGDITSVDFKIKRVGKGTKTQYKWYIVSRSERELSEEELALEVPDMNELIKIKDVSELERLAMEWDRSQNAKKTTGGTNDNDDEEDELEDEIPF